MKLHELPFKKRIAVWILVFVGMIDLLALTTISTGFILGLFIGNPLGVAVYGLDKFIMLFTKPIVMIGYLLIFIFITIMEYHEVRFTLRKQKNATTK